MFWQQGLHLQTFRLLSIELHHFYVRMCLGLNFLSVDYLIKLSPDFVEGYLLTTGGRVKIGRSYPLDITLHELINVAKEKLLTHDYKIAFEGNFLGFVKKDIPISEAVNQNTDSQINLIIYFTL